MLLRWTLFLSGLILSAAQSCYYPNGGLSSSDAPCTDESGDSFCCSSSYYCLSNRLCQFQDGRLYRGSCTDEDCKATNNTYDQGRTEEYQGRREIAHSSVKIVGYLFVFFLRLQC